MSNNKPYVITISHLLGSGGSYIGQELSKALGIRYLDREIITKAAQFFHTNEWEIEQHDERLESLWKLFVHGSIYENPFIYPQVNLYVLTDQIIHEVEVDIMKKAASEESVVILGRVGSHVFNDHPRHLSVFIHANESFRKERVKQLFQLDDEDALNRLEKNDKERCSYYKTFSKHKLTDAKQYTLSIDTSQFGLDETVQILLKYIQDHFINQE